MKYPNIGEKEIADSLFQKLAEILPDLKIEKMELAESKQSFLRYTIYDIPELPHAVAEDRIKST